MIFSIFSKSGIKIYSSLFLLVSFTFDVDFEIHRFIYAVSLAALLNLLRVLDLRFALPELIGFVTILMFMTAPALMFDIGARDFIHHNSFTYDILYVSPTTYYIYAIPAVTLFYIIVTQFLAKYRTRIYFENILNNISHRYDTTRMVYIFGVICFISNLFLGSIPALNNFFSLGSRLLPVILVLSLILKSDRLKKLVFVFVVGLLFLSTLRTGMFSELVFSMLFYALFWVLVYGIPPWVKLLLPGIGILFLVFLQLFKSDYRDETWSGNYKSSNFDAANQVVQQINDDLSFDFVKLGVTVTLERLNMALLCSRVIKYVPDSENYAYGETIVSAIASLIPRALWPDKPELDDRELIKKYGKYTPGGNTTMGITQLGESYANFGYVGGIIFFCIYGFIVSGTLYFLVKRSFRGKPLILFVPIIMYHMTKPEVMFSKSFNTAFTGIIFYFILMVLIDKYCLRKYKIVS